MYLPIVDNTTMYINILLCKMIFKEMKLRVYDGIVHEIPLRKLIQMLTWEKDNLSQMC